MGRPFPEPKFSEDIRCAIIADYIDGKLSTCAIAKKYGCSHSYPATLSKRMGYQTRAKNWMSPERIKLFAKRREVVEQRRKRDWLLVGNISPWRW